MDKDHEYKEKLDELHYILMTEDYDGVLQVLLELIGLLREVADE